MVQGADEDIAIRTNMFNYLADNWRTTVDTYEEIVMKQYLKRDGPPKLEPYQYNVFQGYVHDELSDDEYAQWMKDPELAVLFNRIDYHFREILAAGNAEFDEYQRFWWAYVLRHGHIKAGTTLFYFGEEGTGKGLALVQLMSKGIIGK